MGVPQRRERVFFIANRCEFPKLKLEFHGEPIMFGKVRSERGAAIKDGVRAAYLAKRELSDYSIADIAQHVDGRNTGFTCPVVHDNEVCPTIAASGQMYRYCDATSLSSHDYIVCQTFPQDYDFQGAKTSKIKYICGMSVPPNMMANIATEIKGQWLGV
jgi:DNA (cytosine-5)-methyltransferase 1